MPKSNNHTSWTQVCSPLMATQNTMSSLGRGSKGSSNFSSSQPQAILEKRMTLGNISILITSFWAYPNPRGLQLKSSSVSEQHHRLLSIRQVPCPMVLQLSNSYSFFSTALRNITPRSTQEPTSNRLSRTQTLPVAYPISAKLGQSIYLSPVLTMRSDTRYRFWLWQTPKMFLVFISRAFVIASAACSLYFLVTIPSFQVVSTRAFSLFLSSLVVRPNSYESCLCSSMTLSQPPDISLSLDLRTSIQIFCPLMISQYSYSLALTRALNLGQSMNISSLIFANAISISFSKFCRCVRVSFISFFIPQTSIKNLALAISSCLSSRNRSSRHLKIPTRELLIFSTGLLLQYTPILTSNSLRTRNRCSLILNNSSSMMPSMYFMTAYRLMFCYTYLASFSQSPQSAWILEMFSNWWSK